MPHFRPKPTDTDNGSADNFAVEEIRTYLRGFIEHAINKTGASWDDWASSLAVPLDTKCWEANQCDKADCPAHGNECRRCWLLAGTMCEEEVTGDLAEKFGNCMQCPVYEKAVLADSVREIKEHIIILVNSLLQKTEQLKNLAEKDHLTGLYNRRQFDAYLQHEAQRSLRTDIPFTLMIMDINNFKKMNDRFGHQEGDRVLQDFAGILQQNTRQSDRLFRIGGDEFALVLHQCCQNSADAETFARRVDGDIAEWNLKKHLPFPITLSYGSCTFDRSCPDITTLIRTADRNMYEDKREKSAPLHGAGSEGGRL